MTRAEWERTILADALARTPDRHPRAYTTSGRPVPLICTPDDLADHDPIGAGALVPPDAAVAVGREIAPWSIVQVVDAATPGAANAALRLGVDAGADGLELILDHATRVALDPDDRVATALVGRGGTSVATVDDLQEVLAGIDLAAVPLSVSVPEPVAAAPLLACLLVVAERAGVPWDALRGSVGSDVLGHRLERERPGDAIAAPMALLAESLAFGGAHVPHVRPVVVSGRALRRAGASAQQELSVAIASAVAYVEAGIRVGTPPVVAADGLTFAFSAEGQFFEEVAKLRAARRVWESLLTRRFGVTRRPGRVARVEAQVSCRPPVDGDAWDEVTRAAFRVLAAVLGGADAVHLCLPGALTPRLAVRLQQVLAHESGLGEARRWLDGAWLPERLTRDLVSHAFADLAAIDAVGGLGAIVRQGSRPSGLSFAPGPAAGGAAPGDDQAGGEPITDRGPGDDLVRRRVERVAASRRARDAAKVTDAQQVLRRAVASGASVIPALLAAARAGATIGEMGATLRGGGR